MKRTTLIIILLAVLVVSCLALTACHTHEFVPSVVITKETCTQDGAYVGTCECGKTETVVVKALGHDEIQHASQAPSCDEIGWNAYVTCSRCYYTTYVGIPATGHNFQESETCAYCEQNIADVAIATYDMSATADDNVRGYLVPRQDGNYDAYIKGTGAMKDYIYSNTPFYAVGYDSKLVNAYIEDGVTGIGEDVFHDCYSLTSITIPEGVTSIGSGAFFHCTSLTSITIPESVTSISEYAFYGCTSLTSITIPSSVTSIGEGVFSDCTKLTSITIPSSVTSIGSTAFSSCTSLTSITIPESVTSIGYGAFWGCTSLTSIAIPNSVTSIGEGAFEHCTSLASITIPSSVTSIGNSAFRGCPSLTSINISENNTAYQTIDGNVYSKDGKTLVIYAPGKTDTSFIIPEGVTSIGPHAFQGCSSLISITIPSGVTSIGNCAFYGCTILTSVTFADPNGWYVNRIEGATSGTSLTLTDPSQNATYLNAIYINDYWHKKN